jgi:hypothetical protein
MEEERERKMVARGRLLGELSPSHQKVDTRIRVNKEITLYHQNLG